VKKKKVNGGFFYYGAVQKETMPRIFFFFKFFFFCKFALTFFFFGRFYVYKIVDRVIKRENEILTVASERTRPRKKREGKKKGEGKAYLRAVDVILYRLFFASAQPVYLDPGLRHR